MTERIIGSHLTDQELASEIQGRLWAVEQVLTRGVPERRERILADDVRIARAFLAVLQGRLETRELEEVDPDLMGDPAWDIMPDGKFRHAQGEEE